MSMDNTTTFGSFQTFDSSPSGDSTQEIVRGGNVIGTIDRIMGRAHGGSDYRAEAFIVCIGYDERVFDVAESESAALAAAQEFACSR